MVKRFVIGKQKLSPNFIGSWIIESSLCDEIVFYFEKTKNKQTKGITTTGLNIKVKDRTDISVLPNELKLPENEILKKYFEKLFECYKDYLTQWPFLKSFGSKLNIGSFNLGRYNSGQHFQKVHCERTSLDTLHRSFAFMTYLNDVEEGGSTYFDNYDLEIIPKKGLSILWPADWTHTHKGNLVKKGSKYIITGWLEYPHE